MEAAPKSDKQAIKQQYKYSVSPALATVNSALTLSFLFSAIFPSTYIFATLSNSAYVAAAFYCETVGSKRGDIFGQLSNSSLLLAIMGASSFAFHKDPTLGQPEHTLDIYTGWVLVTHAAYVTLNVALVASTRGCLPDTLDAVGTRVARLILSTCFLAFLTLITIFYDTVYSNQLTFYFTIGPLAAVLGAVCRFLITSKENDRGFDARAVGWAAVELVVLFSALASAIFNQSQLVGRRLNGADPEYDLYHVRRPIDTFLFLFRTTLNEHVCTLSLA